MPPGPPSAAEASEPSPASVAREPPARVLHEPAPAPAPSGPPARVPLDSASNAVSDAAGAPPFAPIALASFVVLVLAVVWTLSVGSLAVARHESLRTNAFDLGYVANTLWHTAHGEPFRFTTVEGAPFAPEGVDPGRIREPHSLLAFHVEPLLLLVAPIYGRWPDPRLLLWFQASAIAVGTLPAAWLGRALVGGTSPRLGAAVALVFGLAWLLAPGLEGAALSDFHMVALGATFLMFGLWLHETGRPRASLAFFALAAFSREDGALAVAWLGVILWLRSGGARLVWSRLARTRSSDEPSAGPRDGASAPSSRRDERVVASGARNPSVRPPCAGCPSAARSRRDALFLALGAGAWLVVCALVLRYFGRGSVFLVRYAWFLHDPLSLPAGDVAAYLLLQIATGGIVCLLAPLELAAAAPLLLMNALSGFDWMRSGGAHYSALVVPLLLWAAAHGARRRPALALGVVLAGALAAQAAAGASPLRRGFAWPAPDPRATGALSALAVIPDGAPVSATSALVPHLAARDQSYWFPAGRDAEWIALDVVGTTYPLRPEEMPGAVADLEAEGATFAAARDGVLVLHRGGAGPTSPPAAFFDFARAPPDLDPTAPAIARFGSALEFVGARLRRWPEVGLFADGGTLESYWRVREPVGESYSFALVTTRPSDGAIVGFERDAAAGAIWYPTTQWPPGQVVRLEMPVSRLARVEALGVAVLDASDGPLPVVTDRPTWNDGTALPLVRP